MSSSSSVVTTLRSITAAKQGELEKKSAKFRDVKNRLLKSIEGVDDTCERIRLLLGQSSVFAKVLGGLHLGYPRESFSRDHGSCNRGSRNRGNRRRYGRALAARANSQMDDDDEIFKISGLDPKNLERLMDQYKYDKAITEPMLVEIETKLKHALDVMERKYEFANLFNKLVTERALPNKRQPATPTSQNDFVLEDFENPSDGGTETLSTQTRVWEAYHLAANPIDIIRLRQSLIENFEDFSPNSDGVHESMATIRLEKLRSNIALFCSSLQEPNQFDPDDLQWIVKGLIATDLLSSEQVATLREIAADATYRAEMADVLNLRISSIETWDWPGPVKLEMRKQLNGKYRAFMHEEIADALLIHYIGVRFCVKFKQELQFLLRPSKSQPGEKLAKERRESFFQNQHGICSRMDATYKNDHFLAQFPDNEHTGTMGYGEDGLAKEADQTLNSGLAIKQALLHLIYTDTMLQSNLGREVVLLQTDFKWFGPSLSHDGIFTILEFFGVTPTWIRFISKFLKAPLQFIHDGPDKPVRVRERGYPMSHLLSTFLGELTLFHLDHAVEKATGGGRLFRLHDDIFFWSDSRSCCKAWATINQFCRDLGLELNMDKTGVARMVSNPGIIYDPLPSELPQKAAKWGFVNLDPTNGSLEIDHSNLDKHVPEFKRQLRATNSVFAWIQAYNAYIQYILNQLISPAASFGRSHVTNSLSFLRELHDRLFPEHNGDPAEALKALIEDRFSVSASFIPTSFLYFPLYLGGLELRNPFVRLHALRAIIPKEPSALIDEAVADDNNSYHEAKELWERDGKRSAKRSRGESEHEFMPYSEFVKYRYEFSPFLAEAWAELRQQPEEEEFNPTTYVESALARLPYDAQGITKKWSSMTNYWKAICILYGDDMVRAYGGMEVVERKLLPMGMVGLWKGGKVRWEG